MPVAAQTQASPVGLEISTGFDGFCKENHWMPVWITLENQGPPLLAEILVETSPAGQGHRHTASLDLPTSSRKRLVIPVFVDGFASRVSVSVSQDGETLTSVTSSPTCLTDNDPLIGVLSDSPSSFNPALDIPVAAGRVFLAPLQLHQIPELPVLLSAVDGLFISDIDTSTLTGPQQRALLQWVTQGGLLLIAGGPASQRTLAGLSDLAGVHLTSTTTARGQTELEDFAGMPIPIEGDLALDRFSLSAGTKTLVEQNGFPVLAERRLGLGSIVFLALDPLAAPVRSWPGMSDLYAKILDLPRGVPAWGQGFSDWGLASQAAAALPGRALPSLTLICGLLVLYVLAIGPLNFWLLRRLGRLEIAWFSTPALVLLFSLMTYLVGNSIRGNQPILHELAVVQSWAGVPVAQVDGLVGIFSPRRSRFNLISGPATIPYPLSRFSGSFPDDLTVHQSQNSFTVPDLRVDVAETQVLAVAGLIEAPPVVEQLQLTADSGTANLKGELTNLSGLSFQDMVIVRGDQVQPVGDLGPESSTSLDVRFDRAVPAEPIVTGFGAQPLNMELVEGIAGSSFSIRSPEDQTNRRFALLNALIGTFGGSTSYHPGIFLMAWSDAMPLDVRLDDPAYETTGTTLYVFQVAVEPVQTGSSIQIPAAYFEWRVGQDSLARNFSAYRTALEAGASAVLEYRPIDPLSYGTIEGLTLNLSAYQQTGETPLKFWLWNWFTEDWHLMEQTVWGPNDLSAPANYLGTDGTIRLRIENPDPQRNVAVERVEFSMTVSP